jgi:hypothetical protein
VEKWRSPLKRREPMKAGSRKYQPRIGSAGAYRELEEMNGNVNARAYDRTGGAC